MQLYDKGRTIKEGYAKRSAGNVEDKMGNCVIAKIVLEERVRVHLIMRQNKFIIGFNGNFQRLRFINEN